MLPPRKHGLRTPHRPQHVTGFGIKNYGLRGFFYIPLFLAI